jgi:hypothetical protein
MSTGTGGTWEGSGPAVDATKLDGIAAMVLGVIHREYPTHVSVLLERDAPLRPPREVTPAFYGSFDWHSAVHGHWCLVRLLRRRPDAPFEGAARAALERSLSPARLSREADHLAARPGFERPYGLAWLLQLAAELREWGDADAARWSRALRGLETLARDHLAAWLPRLPWPIRSGEHAQTAFALGLALDWARTAGDAAFEELIRTRALAFFGSDVAAPIAYEPSGHDFLSPVLGEADLLRRVLPRERYAAWLAGFLPEPGRAEAARWLTPVTSPDRSDGKLAHLDGLNLSRAWMLEGVASALLPADPRRGELFAAAGRHARAGLAAVPAPDYMGSHWLGSFAVYLLTRRGLGGVPAAAPLRD